MVFSAIVAMLAVMLVSGMAFAQTTLRIVGFNEPGIDIALAEFERQNPDIKLEHIDADFDKVTAMILGGDAPDVIRIEQITYGDWARRGWLLDITKYIESDPQLSQPNYFMRQELERIYVDGRAYGFGSSWASVIMYYNIDMFDEAGMEYPPTDADQAWTWDEFLEAGLKLTQDRAGFNASEPGFNPERVRHWGIAGGVPQWWLTDMAIILNNGGKFFNDTVDGFELDHPRTLQALQMMSDWKHRYNVYGGWMGHKNAAMQIWGSWSVGEYRQLAGTNVGLAVLPRAEDMPHSVTWMQGHLYAIPAESKQHDAAWRLMRFIASDEFQAPPVSEGLWIPTVNSMFTPEGIEKWYRPEIHGTDYFDAVLLFTSRYGITYQMPRYLNEAMELYGPAAYSVIVEGTKTPRQAMAEVLDAMNRVIKEGPQD